jgi:hypothetical protein
VRLTVDGTSYTRPLTLRLDPRVKTPAAALTKLASLSKEMYTSARTAHSAYLSARTLTAKLDALSGPEITTFKAQLDSIAPAPPAGGRGGGRSGGGGGGFPGAAIVVPPTLETASAALDAAAMAMQSADVAPTASQIAGTDKARAQFTALMKRWNALKGAELTKLNTKRKSAGQPPITPSDDSEIRQ